MYLGDGLEIGKRNLLGKEIFFSRVKRKSWNMREGKGREAKTGGEGYLRNKTDRKMRCK